MVHYLHTSVAPLLRASYTEEVGRNLFTVTAELTKLAGWAAYDLEEHGLAQRYLIQSLRMARAAEDAALSAEILAAMSHQATYVGRPGDAVDLARAAQIAARSAGLPALEAGCHMVEAHGHAARSDGRFFGVSLNAAERAFNRGGSNRPRWLDYLDSAYMSAKAGRCFLDLGEHNRAATLARKSLDMSDGYQRGRVFNLCLLSSSLATEDPREALRVGAFALELSGAVESRRTHAYLRDVRARLAPHSDIPAVAGFCRQVATATTG